MIFSQMKTSLFWHSRRKVHGLLLRTAILLTNRGTEIFSNFVTLLKINSALFCSIASPLNRKPNQINPVCTLTLHFCNMQFNTDLHLQGHFSFRFSNYSILYVFHPHVEYICSAHIVSFELFTLIIFGEVSNYLVFSVTQILSLVSSLSHSQTY
jgi:hypothetical protein